MKLFILVVLIAGCYTDEEIAAHQAERAKSANQENATYWEWVEKTVECRWSKRLDICLCVYERQTGAGMHYSSEMGMSVAPDKVCKKEPK